MSEELKPCAHCGSDAEFRGDSPEATLDGYLPFWVCCTQCQISSGSYSDKDDAIEEWNTRASPWVSCSDKTPEKTAYYYAVADQEVLLLVFYAQFNTWMGNAVEYRNVTHWMPIPEPPEVG